jgi:hypothetical protein
LSKEPPTVFPKSEQLTVVGVVGSVEGEQVLVLATDPFTTSVIGPTTVTAWEKRTVIAVWVAVAPPAPDWFVNFVIESPGAPAASV